MKRPSRPSLAQLQRQCEVFNERVPVGSTVTVLRDNGEIQTTTTRSKAEVLSGHSAVIWLDGISGSYLLDRVAPVVSATA